MWKSRTPKCTINFLINLLLLHVLAPAWSHHQGVLLALKVTNLCGDLKYVIKNKYEVAFIFEIHDYVFYRPGLD
jgi:hypothetical protein